MLIFIFWIYPIKAKLNYIGTNVGFQSRFPDKIYFWGATTGRNEHVKFGWENKVHGMNGTTNFDN